MHNALKIIIERVLPWLTASLTEDEAKNFLKNLQAGGIIYTVFILDETLTF